MRKYKKTEKKRHRQIVRQTIIKRGRAREGTERVRSWDTREHLKGDTNTIRQRQKET